MKNQLELYLKLKRHLARLLKNEDEEDDEDLEERALQLAIEKTFEESDRQWQLWASSSNSIRIGKLILIVDLDAVVPEDCFCMRCMPASKWVVLRRGYL